MYAIYSTRKIVAIQSTLCQLPFADRTVSTVLDMSFGVAIGFAIGEEAKPLGFEVSDSNRSATIAPTPLFNFPYEKSRMFTAKDLTANLRFCNSEIRKDDKPSKSRMPADEAMKIVNGKFLGKYGAQQRKIFRSRPRSPTSNHVTPENTLPENALPMMKANGELDYAKDKLEWAEMEEEPKYIGLWSPRAKIEETEENIREGKEGRIHVKKYMKAKLVRKRRVMVFPILTFNLGSPRWQRRLSNPGLWYRSATSIDLDHLPKKLSVHDPSNLLAVGSRNEYGCAQPHNNEDWQSKQDRAHVYILELSKNGVKRAKREAEERAKFKEEEAIGSPSSDAENTPTGYLIHPPAIPDPVEPPIFVVRVPPPHPPTPKPKIVGPIGEAHLCLSPTHPIGKGSHSVVYQAD
ncbi:hypothetical protein DXG01_016521 [Tephrocybe rancida]|nr:hypothetical protein DXG01_016521 [Tephrocybe rancida]